MHIRRHTHTFLDSLMFTIMSLGLKDDANSVKLRLIVHVFMHGKLMFLNSLLVYFVVYCPLLKYFS